MNIFVTHPDPHVSAKVLPDKHVVKMPLETCQMSVSGFGYEVCTSQKGWNTVLLKKVTFPIIHVLCGQKSLYNTGGYYTWFELCEYRHDMVKHINRKKPY